MTIKEYLSAYYVLGGSTRLYNDLKVLAETDNVVAGIFKILTRYEDTIIDPDKAVELLENMGILTDDVLLSGISSLNNLGVDFGKLYDYLNPQIDPDWFTETTLYFTEVDYMIRSAGINVGFGFNVVHDDYRMIKTGCFEKVVKANPSDHFKYVMDGRICTGFSEIFNGWLAAQGYGDVSIGAVSAGMYSQGIFDANHAYIIGIEEDGKVMFAEPQDDKYIWSAGETLPYPTWDEAKIYSIDL